MSIDIHIYGKPGCAKCETTKNKVSHFMHKWGMDDSVSVTFYDMSTPDGMAEGAFNDVFAVPTTIAHRSDDDVTRWDGVVPSTGDFRELMMPQNA